MGQEYLTVKQFAEQSGCTPQRVYQLLRNRLQPFLKVENGVKYIHIDGLQEVERARVAQGYNKGLQRVEDAPNILEPEKQVQEQLADSPAGAGADALRITIDALTAQLDAKDKQINDLTAALASAQNTLTEMQHAQQALTEVLTISQETQKQLTDALAVAQALHAGTIQMQQQQVQQQSPEFPVVDASSDLDPEEKGDAKVQSYPKNRKHRGFFANLFGKN